MKSEEKKYKAVMFDLDGTILYTLDDIAAAVNTPLKNRDLLPLDVKTVRTIVGNGLLKTLINAFELREYDFTSQELKVAFIELLDYYENNLTKYSKPYEKIIDFLSTLDIPFALLSNKHENLVKKIVEEKFSGINFYSVEGTKEEYLKKPNPSKVLNFTKQMEIDVEDLLFVGDSEVDYLTSKNANCSIALVSWGYRDREELEKLNVPIVDNTEELWRIIHGN